MPHYLYKQIMAVVVISAAVVLVVPSIQAYQLRLPAPPQVGTTPVYDGGRRAQWRGYLYKNESWWKRNQRFQRSPGSDQSFADKFFRTTEPK